MQSIGGFFASLKLVTDEPSVNRGVAAMRRVGYELGQLVKLTAGLLVVKAAFSGWMALMQRDQLVLAKLTNMATADLQMWIATVGAAGVSSTELAGALAMLDSRIQRMKLGEVDINMAKSLGMLGIGFSQFAGSNGDERTRKVLARAWAMDDERKAAELVANILGEAGREYFWWTKISGESLESQLATARALLFTNERTKKDALLFSLELNRTWQAGKEMGALFGSTLAAQLIPVLKGINALIIGNKQLITTNIVKFATDLGKLLRDIFGLIERGIPLAIRLFSALGGVEGIVRKIAIGFATWKIMEMSQGLTALSRNMSAFAGGGLAFAGLYLILDDVVTYMSGGRSAIGLISKAFSDMLPEDVKRDINELVKILAISIPGIAKDLKPVMDFVSTLATLNVGTGLQRLADTLTTIHDVIKGIVTGNFDTLWSRGPLGKMIKGFESGNWNDMLQGLVEATAMSGPFGGTAALGAKSILQLQNLKIVIEQWIRGNKVETQATTVSPGVELEVQTNNLQMLKGY